ncbi:hypothetical protein HLB27_03405 [Dickeya dadantii]|uniref:hypothetical protein n=1 Tax=Dickeya dadantii TaxID=204038 RepID=UPI001495B00E|nr:hypothetical protein [Dickeya dadantii]NPE57712.1 hypothetical protein [Dickeya dadantii]NPE69814.1 hypothetical protein [Dickeya dadantii]
MTNIKVLFSELYATSSGAALDIATHCALLNCHKTYYRDEADLVWQFFSNHEELRTSSSEKEFTELSWKVESVVDRLFYRNYNTPRQEEFSPLDVTLSRLVWGRLALILIKNKDVDVSPEGSPFGTDIRISHARQDYNFNLNLLEEVFSNLTDNVKADYLSIVKREIPTKTP